MALSALDIINKLDQFNQFEQEDETITEALTISRQQNDLILQLKNCIFEKAVKITFENSNRNVLNFTGSTFNGPVVIELIRTDNPRLVLDGAKFEQGFSLKSQWSMHFECRQVEYNDTFDVSDCGFDAFYFEEVTCNNQATFNAKNIKINAIGSFRGSKFGNANFEKVVINSKVSFDNTQFTTCNFSNAVFGSDVYMNNVQLGARASFNGAEFKGTIIAPSLNTHSRDCSADFSGCNFAKRVYFDTAYFKSFTCIRSTFSELASFNGSNIQSVNFIGTLFLQGADFAHTEYETGSIETFRILKSESIKSGSRVESLYYQSKELTKYYEKMSWKQRPLEKTMLFLNRASSDFGINWGRGVIFTIVVSLLFYSVYIYFLPGRAIEFGWNGWHSFAGAFNYSAKHYIRFLSLFREFDFIDKTTPNWCSYLIDFTGRIFIGFGVYQTIQAFRKYGKS